MKSIADIVVACKEGNQRAQYELFTLTGPKMLGLCRRYCSNDDLAHEAMQEGFIKVFTSLEKYRGESSIETWMGRIFINTAIDSFKKSKRYEDFHHTLPENFDTKEETDEISDFPCTPEQVISAMDEMPDGYRVIFNMFCVEGFSHKHIAATLNISEGTSKSQYARARKFLFERLSKKYSGTRS